LEQTFLMVEYAGFDVPWLSDMIHVLTSPALFHCQAIVARKKIFYGMKVKTLKRKFADIRNRLTAVRDHLTQPYEDRIRTLYHAMKEVIAISGEFIYK